MPAPVNGFIRVEPDTSNLGKKLRTQVRSVAATDVHEHFFVVVPSVELRNVFHVASGVQSVQATAQNGTSTGFFWLELPVSATTLRIRVRKVECYFTTTGTTAMLTVPRIAIQKFTFTGAASGATITAVRARSATAPTATLRTASTGMAVTLGDFAYSMLPPNVLTGVGAIEGAKREYEPISETGRLDLGPGAGIVMYQPDAGTASDQRRFSFHVTWDEYDAA